MQVQATPYWSAVRAAAMALPVPIRVRRTRVSDQGSPIILIALRGRVPSMKELT